MEPNVYILTRLIFRYGMNCEERRRLAGICHGRNAEAITVRIYHRDDAEAKDLDDGCNDVKDAHAQGSVLEARHLIYGWNKRTLSTLNAVLRGWWGRGLTDTGLCYQPKGAHLQARMRAISHKVI